MLSKLQELEQALIKINKQYHIVATELANLKNKPDNEPAYTKAIDELSKQLTEKQNALIALQNNYQSSQSALAEKTHQIQLLNEENRLLAKQNKELKDKNQLALERAETILTWLSNIDNAKNA